MFNMAAEAIVREPDGEQEGMSLACGHSCLQILEKEVYLLLEHKIKPLWWTKDSKVCFRLLDRLFEASYNISGSMEEVIRNALNCLDPDLSIPTQISSNLKKKVTKFMRSKGSNT